MPQLQQVMSLVRYALLIRPSHVIQRIVSLGCPQSQWWTMDLLVRSVEKRVDGRIYSHISLNFNSAIKSCIYLSDPAPPLEFLLFGMLIYWQPAVSII